MAIHTGWVESDGVASWRSSGSSSAVASGTRRGLGKIRVGEPLRGVPLTRRELAIVIRIVRLNYYIPLR